MWARARARACNGVLDQANGLCTELVDRSPLIHDIVSFGTGVLAYKWLTSLYTTLDQLAVDISSSSDSLAFSVRY